MLNRHQDKFKISIKFVIRFSPPAAGRRPKAHFHSFQHLLADGFASIFIVRQLKQTAKDSAFLAFIM